LTATISALFHDDESAVERELWEIDENLAGPTLSKAERAIFTKRRKEIYEQLHPEPKQGQSQALGMNHAKGANVSANFAPTFTADTADKTGQSERSVQLDAARGEKILEELLEVIPGTSLDSGVELDVLLKLTPEQQRELDEKIKAGQDVSARPVTGSNRPLAARADGRNFRNRCPPSKAFRLCKAQTPALGCGS
jgi:hypothetical protein